MFVDIIVFLYCFVVIQCVLYERAIPVTFCSNEHSRIFLWVLSDRLRWLPSAFHRTLK